MAMRGVNIVVHAAALKHVPAAEYNPFECIHTNVLGAENVVKAAIRAKVKKVIALSTDKAVNPINLYGASKLAADKIFIAANRLAGPNDARFAVVRYGNVIGSRGSVVPFYRKLIRSGATTLPITDPRMTRFWITLSQGVNFVLTSLEMMGVGEVFVPKIPSMKIVDLARALAPNFEQEIVGIRPGEKLHETLITEDDSRTTLELDDRYVIVPSFFKSDKKWRNHEEFLVGENFRYASDGNDEWLDANSLAVILDESRF
jgi:UDP-N-acetylglucosamine 4,6-dehydratase